MADITLANSTYSTGTNDTASTLVNNVTATDAQQYNGAATAIIGLETILGTGTDLKGSTADLVARLAVEHNADGTQKTLTVAKGGTGVTTLADGAVLVGNAAGVVQALALPSTSKVLTHTGTALADPAWGSGLLYHGPSSVGAGSTRSHEGSVTVSANGNYSGIHYYTDFTLNAGVTMTIPAGKCRLVILSTGTITINGTIDGTGGGVIGGKSIPNASGLTAQTGWPGTDQPGGGGNGAEGGNVCLHGTPVVFGGIIGGAGTQVSGSDIVLAGHMFSNASGGASGGGGIDDGVGPPGSFNYGGRGGASIVLIAPVIVLAATATLKTNGAAGAATAASITGGGGAGNVYILTSSYTDNGCTFTMTGGAAGGVGAGAGANGVKQINIYA